MPFPRLGRTLLTILCVPALLGGCDRSAAERAAERAADSQLPEWEVAETPRLSVGDREDGDIAVFLGVSDARWHANGRLIVADGGAFAVKVYDASGRPVAVGGRRGRGPGEFGGGMALADAPGDSVFVWDPSQTRWTLLSTTDGGMRNVTRGVAQPVWLHAGILVYSALEVPPAWVPRLLGALSESTPEARIAHLDRSGLLFVNEDVARRRWRVYRDSAAAIAAVTLPDSFALLHVADSVLVGVVSDSIGLQQVAVHVLHRRAHQPPDLTPATPPPLSDEARAQLMATLRNAVTAQEMRYAIAGAYTPSADTLGSAGQLPVPEGARFRVLEATNRGWSGVAWYPANGFTCGMIIGLANPPGWMEGAVNCGWQQRSTEGR